jgi:hypothetical protein
MLGLFAILLTGIVIRESNGKIELFDATPDPSLIAKEGKAGYTLGEGVGELADNSIDARRGRVLKIAIKITPHSITIVDDGTGMEKLELQDAMVYARTKKGPNCLGFIGVGMKKACANFGDHFEVISMKNGSKECYKTWWDREEQKNWMYPIVQVAYEDSPADIKNGGTIVEITRLHMNINQQKILSLCGDLGKRYAHFIKAKEVQIIVNDDECKALLPEIMPKTKKELDIDMSNGGKITGWVALLKHSSQGLMYGFNTYRKNRLITTYDKIGFKPHATTARVTGEIYLDGVPVVGTKNNWERESTEFEEAEALITEAIKDIVALSRSFRETKISNSDKQKLEQYKEGLRVAIASKQLIEYTLPETIAQKKTGTVETDEEQEVPGTKDVDVETKKKVEIEKREKPVEPDHGTRVPADTGRKRIPKKTHLVIRKNVIQVKGRKFDYSHEFHHLGEEGPIYARNFDAVTRKLEILTNEDFPAIKIAGDKAFYAFVNIVDAISAVIIDESEADWSKFDEVKQILMREASKHVVALRDSDARK